MAASELAQSGQYSHQKEITDVTLKSLLSTLKKN